MADPVVFVIDVLGTGEEPRGGDYAATIKRTDPDSSVLRVTDLGVMRGDGIFETIGVVGGHPQAIDAHLARLANSAAILELPVPNIAQWRVAIDIAAGVLPREAQGGIKLVITRGIEETGIPTAWIAASVADSDFEERQSGIRVITLDRGYSSEIAPQAPWLLAGAKTLSYAVNMAAQREAVKRGADDAVFVSTDGYVMEAPTSTVILRQGDRFVTPRTDIGILPGTTQLALFDFYREAGFIAEEALVPVSEMASSDGVWLVSSVRLAAPVREIDGVEIRHDRTMTDRMNESLLARDT